jgi:hypothetical protein
MSIKRFLILIFMIIISIAIYLNVKYLDGITIEKNSKSIDNYVITEIWCHNSPKMSNTMTIEYRGKKYFVSLSGGVCSDIDKGLIKPELYYMKAKDKVFYKGQYFPLVYVYLTYIASFLLPLFGFWIYRKELNNHYSTM